jgi:predicted nuclease of predicted toxin-antitoxin system
MRFLADENISNLVISKLETAGHNVQSVRRSHAGIDDKSVLEIAGLGDCVLITEDQDFGDLVVRQKLPVLGVILLELDRLSNTAEARRVMEVVDNKSENLIGRLTVVEPTRIRSRSL